MPSEALDDVQEHALGALAQIPRGEGRNFLIAGRRVAVFRTHRDEVFATQADCPHLHGPLADGMVGGAVVVCPLHERVYDLRTGRALAGECDLQVYPIRRTAEGTMMLTLV